MSEILGFDRERIWDWAYSQALLAACWEIEEGGKRCEGWFECATSIRHAV